MFKRVLLGCLLVVGLAGCAAGPALFGPSTGTATKDATGSYAINLAPGTTR